MGMNLFDDSGDDDVEKISNIEINTEFAKRYEHNKKREDLQRLEEMKKKGLIPDSGSDSESESESESYDEDDDDDVKALFDGLLKVRKKDPILKERDAKLFESSSDEDEDDDDDVDGEESGDGKKREKEKPKYLKDVRAQHLIEEGAEFDEDEDNEKEKVKTYVEDQEDLRKAVLDAMAEAEKENGDEDGDFLKLKERERENPEDDGGVGDEEIEKRLDEYFGEDEKLDENNKFLKDFFKKKLWIDKDKEKRPIEDDLVGISDDEEALEKQEDYEREYNFRFEENASDRVLGHSRFIEGSVRKETNARKQQRERKKERLAQAELERREEVKRLKNLKKKEIQERLDKIREIAGVSGESIPLTEEDLEEDFDPDEFDKKMKAAFGDTYYEAEDADPGFGSDGDESESDLEKPDFEKEDELLGLPKDWDVIKSNDGFLAEREKRLKSKVHNEGDGDDDQLLLQEGKKKRKRKLSLKEKLAVDKELEELYKLDYEDAIGDLKTRFKYRDVAPRKYGLSAAHILMMDDKELNQYVSLKKLAPYREKEWAVPRMQRTSFMLKKGALLEAAMNRQVGRKRRRRTELGETSRLHGHERAQMEQPSNDEINLSRAAKRRRRQKGKKLPQSRLLAYGKIPSSSKNKSKS